MLTRSLALLTWSNVGSLRGTLDTTMAICGLPHLTCTHVRMWVHLSEA